MLRFINHTMTSIEGIEIYPVISLVIFLLFFASLIWWLLKADKTRMEEIRNYPLDDAEVIPTDKVNGHREVRN